MRFRISCQPGTDNEDDDALSRCSPCARLLKLRVFGNREAMVSTSPGRQSGETVRNERLVPPGLWDVCCSSFMDLRPWLSHVMPPAFKKHNFKKPASGDEGLDEGACVLKSTRTSGCTRSERLRRSFFEFQRRRCARRGHAKADLTAQDVLQQASAHLIAPAGQ